MSDYEDEEIKNGKFSISFEKKNKLDLQENEKLSDWRISSFGIQMLYCKDDHIKLSAEHKLNWFLEALTGGNLVGDLFLKPLVAKEKIVELNKDNVFRIVISQGLTCSYCVFQTMEDGGTEVHNFKLKRSVHAPYLNERIRGYFPERIIEER